MASVLFFLPWLYLVSRILGKPLPAAAVGLGYATLFVLWITGGVVLPLLVGVRLKQGLIDPYEGWVAPDIVYQALVFMPHPIFWVAVAYCGLVALTNGALWVWLLYRLLALHFRTRRLDPAPSTGGIPDGYLSPFMAALASFVCTPVLGGGGIVVLLIVLTILRPGFR